MYKETKGNLLPSLISIFFLSEAVLGSRFERIRGVGMGEVVCREMVQCRGECEGEGWSSGWDLCLCYIMCFIASREWCGCRS